jgi:hypothetical protein
MSLEQASKSYLEALDSIKQKFSSAQIKAALTVNQEILCLYWEIDAAILERQQNEGWCAKVIDRLSQDLQSAFPNLKRFSTRSLKYMRKFTEIYSNFAIMQRIAAQIPWAHKKIKSKLAEH